MAKRQEPKRKNTADFLQDLRDGHQEAFSDSPADAQRYIDKMLASQGSIPNAVKFFAYDLLVEAAYLAGDMERALEAVEAARSHMAAAEEDTPRELAAYMPSLRFCERGIGMLADNGDVEAAVALCDVALGLGLGKAYEAKKQSLERRL